MGHECCVIWCRTGRTSNSQIYSACQHCFNRSCKQAVYNAMLQHTLIGWTLFFMITRLPAWDWKQDSTRMCKKVSIFLFEVGFQSRHNCNCDIRATPTQVNWKAHCWRLHLVHTKKNPTSLSQTKNFNAVHLHILAIFAILTTSLFLEVTWFNESVFILHKSVTAVHHCSNQHKI